MKNILTTICALFLLGSLAAQIPFAVGPQRNHDLNQVTREIPPLELERIMEMRAQRAERASERGAAGTWASFFDAVEYSGSTPVPYRVWLFPDSNALMVSSTPGEDFYWWIHALTENFDPNSTLMNDLYTEGVFDVPFETGKIYDMDSLAFFFYYQRVSDPSVVDTLRVYLYGDGNIGGQPFDDWPNPGETTDVAYAFYNNNNFKPDGAIIETFEYHLTAADTTSGSAIIEAIDYTIPKGAKMGLAFHYIPGQSYSLGDVLFDFSTEMPGVLNNFELIVFEEDDGQFPLSAITDEPATNQGGIVPTEIRYETIPGGWEVTYFPTFGYTAELSVEHVLVDYYLAPIGAHYIWGETANPCEIEFNDLSNVDGVTNWFWETGDEGTFYLDENPMHTYPENGSYDSELEIQDGTGASFRTSQTVVVTNCSTSGIEGPVINGISLYPNPAVDRMQLDLVLSGPQDVQLGIYDAGGRLVHAESTSGIADFSRSIDVSHLPAGLYNIKLQNGQQVLTKGFMVAD